MGLEEAKSVDWVRGSSGRGIVRGQLMVRRELLLAARVFGAPRGPDLLAREIEVAGRR